MAKVKAPLLSFSASGQIAKALVYFTWKGIGVVRQHVIPANPQTPLQDIQRGYFGDAVDEWHDTKYTASDVAAWNRYAAILAKPMSGFNAFVKQWLDLKVAAVVAPNPFFGCSIYSGGAGLMDVYGKEDGEATTAFCDWGYSKTALVNTEALVEGPAKTWILTDIAVTAGKKVYGRFWSYDNVGHAGYTGIYEFTAV